MIDALVKLFIPNASAVHDPKVRQKYGVFSGFVGIVLNLCLFAGKFFAGLITSSISITADAFNNLSDAGSSIVTLIGFKMAGQQPDNGHPFGHGRIEYVAGLLVSMAIILMGFELAKSSIVQIMSPTQVEFRLLSILILAASICVKLWMFLFNRKLGKKIHSAAMLATSTDSLSDCVATSAVLLGAVAGRLFHLHIDGYVGVLVAGFILYSGFNAARETLNPLLGQAPTPEFVSSIESTVMAHEEIIGIHDLVVHDYGPGRCMISLHAEVPCDGDILEMHDAVDVIERELREKFRCDAIIHMDPIATDDKLTNAKKAEVAAMVKLIDPSVSIHDFRMVVGPTHTNLIFDVVVPHRFRLSDEQITASIQNAVRAWEGNYYAVVNVDKSYV